MNADQQYQIWLDKAFDNAEIYDELKSISGDELAIKERFESLLKFGTAGLRAILGAGTNRINIYMVGWATQGVSNYFLKKDSSAEVAIAYDCRKNSRIFAEEAARVFAANGIKVYLFSEITPTPVLSFTIKDLDLSGGVVITASHNCREYNGYKCYTKEGCQIIKPVANEIYQEMCSLDIFDDVKRMDFGQALSKGLIQYIDQGYREKYFSCVLEQRINPAVLSDVPLKVLYTPLNGTGYQYITTLLKRCGMDNIGLVEEQIEPDSNFSTCPYPNPEFEEAFSTALKATKAYDAELIIATDPDCDRLGVMIKSDKGYRKLNSNEIGCLLAEYILSQRKKAGTLPENPLIIKTIVTGNLIEKIAGKYHCQVTNVHTGFKNIATVISELDHNGQADRFVFACEDSHGFLCGNYVRDKDAALAAMLFCEMTAYYKSQGLSLTDVLDGIYREYGFYIYGAESFEVPEYKKTYTLKAFMDSLRAVPPEKFADQNVSLFCDYQNLTEVDFQSKEIRKIKMEFADLITFSMEDGSMILVRPSGTEPKLKLYYMAISSSKAEALDRISLMKDDLHKLWQLCNK